MAAKGEEEDIEMKPMVATANADEGITPDSKPAEPDPVIEAIATQSALDKLSIKTALKGSAWAATEPVTMTWHLSTSLSERLPMSVVQVIRPGSASVPFELHVDGERQDTFTPSDDTKLLLTKELNGKKVDVYSIAHSADFYAFMIAVDDVEVCTNTPVKDLLFSYGRSLIINGIAVIILGVLAGAGFYWLTGRLLIIIACSGMIIAGIGMLWRAQVFNQFGISQNDHCKWMMARL